MKQLAWYTAVILLTLAAALLLWEFRIAIILFVLSLTVAAILRPMVDFLASHKIPRGLALVITFLAVVCVVAALGLFLGGPIVAELQSLAADLPGNYDRMKTQWLAGSWIQQSLAQGFPDSNNLFQVITGGQWNTFIQNFLGMTLGSIDLLSKIAIVLVLSIYWTIDQDHFKRLWLSLLPSDMRSRWRAVWENMEREIGAYLRSELIQSLLTLIFLAVGYQLIGLNDAVLLAVFGAVSWLIAWFGGLAAVILALLAGLAISPVMGLAAAFFTLAVLAFLEFVVEPRLFNNQRLSSLLVVIMVLIMVKEYGMIGFIAAPPIAAAIQIFASQLLFRPNTRTIPLAPPPDMQIDLLKERLDSVRLLITEQPEPPTPEIINLVDRLEDLIDRAHQEEGLSA